MRRARSKTASLVYALFVIAITGYLSAAVATDVLNCQSPSWALAIAVGSDGYVNSLLVHNKTPSPVQEPVVVSNFFGEARRVDIQARVINVEANAPSGKALNIRLKNGKGHIQYLDTLEQLDCDWTT